MSEGFDAYRKWLGIPPEDQPPHFYRLLGIAVFEDDPDVIENAANRQMTHVRTFQAGRHAEQSQKILNELSSARICLLNTDKKANYDATLKEQLRQDREDEAAATAAAAPPRSPPPKVAPPRASAPPLQSVEPPPAPSGPLAAPPLATAVAVAPLATAIPIASPRPMVSTKSSAAPRTSGFPSPGSQTSATKRSQARRKSSPWPLLLGIVAVVILVGLVAAMSNMNPNDKEKEQAGNGRGNGTSGEPRPSTTVKPKPRPAEPPRYTRPVPEPLTEFTPAPPTPPRTDDPRPKPRPQPTSDKPFPELIKEALQSLAQRNEDGARKALEIAANVGEGLEQEADLKHTLGLLFYIEDFAKAVNSGLQWVKRNKENGNGDSFEFEDRKIQLLSLENNRLAFTFGDDKIEIAPIEMKPRHALAFASRVLDFEDPNAKIRIATFLALDRDSTADDKRRAEALLKQAAEQGIRDEHLAWLLKFPMHELPASKIDPDKPRDPDNANKPMPAVDDDDPFGLKEQGSGGLGKQIEKPSRPKEGRPKTEPRPNDVPRPDAAAEIPLPANISAAAAAAARERLDNRFSTKLAEARLLASTRPALIAEFLAAAKSAEEPVDKFALLEAARDWAARTGNSTAVVAAIEAMAEKFQIDELGQKKVFLDKCFEIPSASPDELMRHAIAAKNFARSEGRLELAVEFGELIVRAAQKIGNAQILQQSIQERQELQRLVDEQSATKPDR